MGKAGAVYAVRVGRKTGIFENWDDCKAQTEGYPGAKHKKFPNVVEAQVWLDEFSQSAGNVFPAKPTSATRSIHGAHTSAAPYSVPSKEALGKQKVSTHDDARDLEDAQSDAIVVYTDGASKNNQDAASRIAGYGVHWARGRPSGVEGDIAARCPGEGQTNNIGELSAIVRALELTKDDPRPLRIYTDSKYCIECLETYIKGWVAKQWRKKDGSDIANVEIIRYADALRRLRCAQGWDFKIEHVKGHASSKGNITADTLANQGCLLPLDKPEPDWVALREQVDARIDQILLDGVRKKGQVVEAKTTVQEDPNKAALTTIPVTAPASNIGLDDFSDIPFLDEDELLQELAAD